MSTVTAYQHAARAPIVPANHPDQRRYGADVDAAYDGVPDALGAHVCAATVCRMAGKRFAALEIQLGFGHSRRATVEIDLDADGLRELARCLLDAAHDIERGAQEVAA